MIKNFQESDFIDAFQDLPIYIGNDQSGEQGDDNADCQKRIF